MKYSLGIWLVACLVGLQLVAVMIVVSSSYLTSERALLDHARDLLGDVGVNTETHAKSFLAPARGAAELASRLAENEIVSSDDRIQLERLLFQQLQTAPQFAGVFYGDESGNFVYVNRSDGPGPFRSKIIRNDGAERQTDLIWRDSEYLLVSQREDPEDTYDPRARPWYLNAKSDVISNWTDPYIFFSSQRPGITISSPVFDEGGAVKGVIGVDIEISAISEFLAELKVGESGTALIINRNGDVIAHPRPELLKAEQDDGTFRFASIFEIDDPIARKAFGQTSGDEPLDVARDTFAEFTHDGETYVSLVMPAISTDLPWTIAVYAPERDFVGAIKENRFQNIWIAAATAIVTGLVGLLLANSIHRPVRAFAVRSALISQGEIDPSEPMPKTYKELDQANQALTEQIKKRRNSEHQYGQTFELASRGMAQLDPITGRVLHVNEAFARILGYSVDEILTLGPADLTNPDDPMLFGNIAEASPEDHALNLEKRCIRKDGETVWVKINTIMIRDSDGKHIYTLATIDDITKVRAAETQIHKLNRDLSHLARGKLLGQMAAGLAHELNQPLTAITQNAEAAMLTLEQDGRDRGELTQILGELDEQAHRASDIIKALRGFARKGEDWKARFDMNELLDQALRLVNAEATEHGITINVEGDKLPPVLGMRVQIAQVLVNLLRNAIESIAASTDTAKLVTVLAQVQGDFVEVAVQDTGPGVQQGTDLFGQFVTTKDDGMGLGLSICRSIVEAGGGSIIHDAGHNPGARFVFTVPLAEKNDSNVHPTTSDLQVEAV